MDSRVATEAPLNGDETAGVAQQRYVRTCSTSLAMFAAAVLLCCLATHTAVLHFLIGSRESTSHSTGSELRLSRALLRLAILHDAVYHQEVQYALWYHLCRYSRRSVPLYTVSASDYQRAMVNLTTDVR